MSRFYESIEDVGSHEEHIIKIGNFMGMSVGYRVTYVENSSAEVISNNFRNGLKVGSVIGFDALIKTNNSRVEITASDGFVYRLGGDSEFCVENTIEGLKPVFFGSVYFSPPNETVMAGGTSGGKYRTSCWILAKSHLLIENVDDNTDRYYAFEKGFDVYEYDESGREFLIMNVKPFTSCDLYCDLTKPMRERYTVVNEITLNRNDVTHFYNEYVSPVNWNEQFDLTIAPAKVS